MANVESDDDLEGFFDSFDRLDTHILNLDQHVQQERILNSSADDSSCVSLADAFRRNTEQNNPTGAATSPSTVNSSDRVGAGKSQRKKLKRPREEGSALYNRDSSTNRQEPAQPLASGSSSPALLWDCSRCTLLNASVTSHCAACGAPRSPLPSSRRKGERDGSASLIEIACPQCTYINKITKGKTRARCEMCETALPRDALVSSRMVSLSTRSEGHYTPTTEPKSKEKKTGLVISSSSARSDLEESSSESTSLGDSDDDEESISSFSSSSSYNCTNDGDESESSAETPSPETAGESSDALVDFLQQLTSFSDATDLPCAPVPESMASCGQLQPFQLQGLYWLLSREKRQVSIMAAPSPSSTMPSLTPSSGVASSEAQPRESMCNGTGDLHENHAVATFMDMNEDQNMDPSSTASGLDKVRGGILADFMGLGKTRTLISLCESTRDRGRRSSHVSGSEVVTGATLVVAPTSLVGQWIAEIRECVRPAPRILHYHGHQRKRKSFFQIAEDYDYVFVSYQTLRAEAFPVRSRGVCAQEGKNVGRIGATRPSPFASSTSGEGSSPRVRSLSPHFNLTGEDSRDSKMRDNIFRNSSPLGHLFMIKWNRIILDEAHYIRNSRSKLCRSCFLLSSGTRWVVSATPIQNSVNDVFPLLQFLQVPLFADVKWWNREIIEYLRHDFKHPRPITALRLLFSSLALRRLPSTKINGTPILNLPPISVESVRVRLSRVEKQFYSSVYTQSTTKMQRLTEASSQTSAVSSAHGSQQQQVFRTAFEMLIRCRQACLHPYIVVAALRRIRVGLYSQDLGETKEGTDNGGTFLFSGVGSSQNDHLSSSNPQEEARKKAVLEKEVMHFIDKKLLRMLKKTARERQIGRPDSNEENSVVVKDLISSHFVQELIQALREHTLQDQECLICLEEMNAPGILPCGHTFCYDCVSHAVEVAHRCPTCKHPTTVKKILPVPEDLLNLQPYGVRASSIKSVSSYSETDVFRLSLTHDISQYANWPLSFSSKTEELLRCLQRIPSGEKCIIFSSFTSYLFYLKHYLDTKTRFNSAVLVGSLSLTQKNKVLERFRSPVFADEESTEDLLGPPTILLATITACGVGLNLACANHGFIMDPTYNPGVEVQAIHRMHRMGQTKPVKVLKFLGDETVELKVEQLCKLKGSMHSCCFGEDRISGSSLPSPSSGRSYRLTAEELRMLFS